MSRGYFGVAMYQPKNEQNWGSLLRTSNLLGASFIACIGQRFKSQASDTMKSHKHIPVFYYKTFEEFKLKVPHGCRIVAVELDEKAQDLADFSHPQQAVYLMGAEDYGLPKEVLKECNHIVKLKGERSMNVSCAGSIVLYHREAL